VLYPSSNEYGFPDLEHAPLSAVPDYLVPFKTRLRWNRSSEGLAVHFFLDDYRIQSAFSKPYAVLTALQKTYSTVLTPDFSVYTDWPKSMQLWNIYRSRWCGAFWRDKSKGRLTVIPTAQWSTRTSFDYCFTGLPVKSVVAISTLGISPGRAAKGVSALFIEGYHEMVARLQPSLVLCYGSLPDDLNCLAPVKVYPTRWQDIRAQQQAARKHGW
jgi:hypothetical protein